MQNKRRLNISPAELSTLKEHYKLSKCFYPNCEHKAIKAHSIQLNGPLSVIADSVGNQMNHVYTLNDELVYIPDIDTVGSIHDEGIELKSLGIGTASTFKGFCLSHDGIFKNTIEDTEFTGSKEQCFYHTYRAFSYFFHELSSMDKGMKGTLDQTKKILNIDVLNSDLRRQKEEIEYQLKGTKHETLTSMLLDVNKGLVDALSGFSDFAETLSEVFGNRLTKADVANKQILDKMVLSNNYDDFVFCKRSIKGVYPIVCSTIVDYLHHQLIIPSEDDGVAYSSRYAITIFPDIDKIQTHFIVGALKGNPNVDCQMELMKNMKLTDFLKLLSNLLISRTSNTFLSPRMLRNLSNEAIQSLLNNIKESKEHRDNGVYQSSFNLFNPAFLEHK